MSEDAAAKAVIENAKVAICESRVPAAIVVAGTPAAEASLTCKADSEAVPYVSLLPGSLSFAAPPIPE